MIPLKVRLKRSKNPIGICSAEPITSPVNSETVHDPFIEDRQDHVVTNIELLKKANPDHAALAIANSITHMDLKAAHYALSKRKHGTYVPLKQREYIDNNDENLKTFDLRNVTLTDDHMPNVEQCITMDSKHDTYQLNISDHSIVSRDTYLATDIKTNKSRILAEYPELIAHTSEKLYYSRQLYTKRSKVHAFMKMNRADNTINYQEPELNYKPLNTFLGRMFSVENNTLVVENGSMHKLFVWTYLLKKLKTNNVISEAASANSANKGTVPYMLSKLGHNIDEQIVPTTNITIMNQIDNAGADEFKYVVLNIIRNNLQLMVSATRTLLYSPINEVERLLNRMFPNVTMPEKDLIGPFIEELKKNRKEILDNSNSILFKIDPPIRIMPAGYNDVIIFDKLNTDKYDEILGDKNYWHKSDEDENTIKLLPYSGTMEGMIMKALSDDSIRFSMKTKSKMNSYYNAGYSRNNAFLKASTAIRARVMNIPQQAKRNL